MASSLPAAPVAAPGAAPAHRRRPAARQRRGSAYLLGLLYLMLFSALALGFFAQSSMSSQMSGNERRVYEAQIAAESAAQFMRHRLDAVNIPAGLTQQQAFEELYMQLAGAMEPTKNLGGQRVGYTPAGVGVKATITIPESPTAFIRVAPAGPGFRAIITDNAPGIDVKLVGSAGGGATPRAIQFQYQRNPKPYSLIGIESLTLGGTAFTDSYHSSKGPYGTTSPRAMGSIASNGNITLNNTARINGDVYFGPTSVLTLAAGAKINGQRARLSTPLVYPSVTLPPAGTYTDLGDVNMTTGTSNNPGGVYVINRLSLGGNALINWQGPVTIYVRTSYTVSDGVVINTYGNLPKNRKLYFLPTCTTATWSGTNTCVGELYAPDTHFTISGSVQKHGYVIAKSINNTSSGGMHYDEALMATNGQVHYRPVLSSYAEVRP